MFQCIVPPFLATVVVPLSNLSSDFLLQAKELKQQIALARKADEEKQHAHKAEQAEQAVQARQELVARQVELENERQRQHAVQEQQRAR